MKKQSNNQSQEDKPAKSNTIKREDVDPLMLPAILGNEYLGPPVSLKQAFGGAQLIGRFVSKPFIKAFNALKDLKPPKP